MARFFCFCLSALVAAGNNAAPGTEGSLPVSARDSLKLIHTKPGLKVELVASEPQIVDPVAIDWGADGNLWVCEMHDYPTGVDENFQPGGRIKILEDSDGDGFYEKATLFLDGLAFPTGVTAWGRGAYISAAPDLIYAEDTNGDGKADRVEKMFTGFATDNYQARLNSLGIGLDNWIYGANGLLGGVIRGVSKTGEEINIRNRDFRFNPSTGVLEPVSGLSQYGRVRDDWGNWFGCDNSNFLFHFPWNERYARRNPAISVPSGNVYLPMGGDTRRIFPISKLQERYNDPDNANRVTSAGGLGIYRDTLLGEEYYGNAFTCEAVHNLVHREIIRGDGVRLSSGRASDEEGSEFFASSDNWFRPAQVRTGPDGALYVVDMYRFLIEHPRWIAAKRLAQIDVRAGSDKGRIYRVKAVGKELRPIRNLRAMSGREVAATMDSPNGTDRDRAHVELLTRRDAGTVPILLGIAQKGTLPQARLQALSAAEGLGGLKEGDAIAALRDVDGRVRANALALSEKFFAERPSDELVKAILSLTNDVSKIALHQLAYSAGEWNDPRGSAILASLAARHPNDVELRQKILTSASRHAGSLLKEVGNSSGWRASLIATLAAFGELTTLEELVKSGIDWNEQALLLEGASRRGMDLGQAGVKAVEEARRVAFAESGMEEKRVAALNLISKAAVRNSDVEEASKLLASASQRVREKAAAILRRSKEATVAREALGKYSEASPTVRGELLGLLMERTEWTLELLGAIGKGIVQPSEISITDRQRLLQNSDVAIRRSAGAIFQRATSRDEVLKNYGDVKGRKGDVTKGGEVFARACATCHAFNGTGVEVGPDLAALRGKDVEYLVKNILDPNAIVEPRFVAYNVELKDERTLLGIIKAENGSTLTLMTGGGQKEEISRSAVQAIRAATTSLMPEGLEQGISVQEMTDLIAYLKSSAQQPASAGAEVVLRDPVSVARFVLDESQPQNLRETAIKSNPQFAGALIEEMSRDLPDGAEEYRRIPWIWRVAIASGKRNEAEQLKRVIDVSLPKEGEPLRDWQAVVIGGGVINGISQRQAWPGERIAEILRGEDTLKKRWERALDLATEMADNEKVAPGTRYDALRMLGVEPWEKRGTQLVRYLADQNGELQMGAVSGLADVNSPEAAKALRAALPSLTDGNRKLAEEGLKRFEK